MQSHLAEAKFEISTLSKFTLERRESTELLKRFAVRHFDKFLMAIIFSVAIAGAWLIEEKTVLLNFYYLPVLFASYFFGRRLGVFTAVTCILAVLIGVSLFPDKTDDMTLKAVYQLSSWSGFLILAAAAVGTLYEKHERRLQELKNAYIGILEILSKYLESADRYTKGHSVRVSDLAMEIAIAMELPRAAVENVRAAGLLHDIGKIEISSDILRKAAELSSEEKELVDLHATKGAYLLSSVGTVLKEVVPIVLAHHMYFLETLDLSNGDKGKIPLGARIVAVADAFDAMTTDRPYRKGMPPWKALDEIADKSGKQFDPEVTEAFKRVINRRMDMI